MAEDGRTHLGMPGLGPSEAGPGDWAVPVHYRLDRSGGAPPLVLRVFDLGLACCAVEFAAAVSGREDLPLVPAGAAEPGEGSVEVMVVSGTVTDKLAPAVLAAYEALPEPKRVVSFGSCANSGGPYWDSYCVTKGVDQIVPVDVYVPGCPPRPEALVQGLLVLEDKLAGERA